MARQLLDDGHLRLLLLEIDGRPAAFDLSVCTEGYTFSYQTGFDPAVAHLRVGQVVLAEVIARAIDRGDRILDLGRGDEEYKAHWRAVPVPLESVQISTRHPAAVARFLAVAGFDRFARSRAGQVAKEARRRGLALAIARSSGGDAEERHVSASPPAPASPIVTTADRSLTVSTVLAMGAAAMEIIGLFVVGWITARQLGPQGKGEYTAIITWVLVIAWVASVGLRDSVAFFQSRNPERSPEIFTTSLLYTVVLAADRHRCGPTARTLGVPRQSDDVIAIARVAFFGIFLIVAFQTAEGLLSGQHRFALLSGIQAFSSVGAAVIMGLFALFGGLSVGTALIGKLGIYVLCAGRCTRRRARPGSARATVAAIGA